MKIFVEQSPISKEFSFEDIPLELPDVFRGQYFIEPLEKAPTFEYKDSRNPHSIKMRYGSLRNPSLVLD